MDLNKIKNKLFLFFDKFREHRIYQEKYSDTIKYYCQYKTLIGKQWKTYQTYRPDGYMQRAVFNCSDNNIGYKMAEDFMNSLNNKMFIGWNNFKK